MAAQRGMVMTAVTGGAGLARRAAVFELSLWRSLYRWLLRRPVAIGGAEGFGYASAVAPLFWAFIVMSAIEIPIAHLLLPWTGARRVVLALGVWGLTWMIGLLASLRVHPHVVGDSGMRVRYGTTVDITIPWEAIAAIRLQRRNLAKSRTVQLDRTDSAIVLNIGVSSHTNIDVDLRRPTTVDLPRNRLETITRLHFYADDPTALITRAREHLAAHIPSRDHPRS